MWAHFRLGYHPQTKTEEGENSHGAGWWRLPESSGCRWWGGSGSRRGARPLAGWPCVRISVSPRGAGPHINWIPSPTTPFQLIWKLSNYFQITSNLKIQNLVLLMSKNSKLCRGVYLHIMNNFIHWPNYKLPMDFMLLILEQIPI
jgi:hypothetical protein